ncbi:hypothetical protein [Paenibacillus wenxiniae]|uniref:Uncharacterized protein n=1 Tax=Paenibacillus wenxiniae TaxID=1636843 RepID=A0ABW4RF33_9BACL
MVLLIVERIVKKGMEIKRTGIQETNKPINRETKKLQSKKLKTKQPRNKAIKG